MTTQKEKKQKQGNIQLAKDINHHNAANPIKDDKYNKAYERFKRPAYYQAGKVNVNEQANQKTK